MVNISKTIKTTVSSHYPDQQYSGQQTEFPGFSLIAQVTPLTDQNFELRETGTEQHTDKADSWGCADLWIGQKNSEMAPHSSTGHLKTAAD